MSNENSNGRVRPKDCSISCNHVAMEMDYPRTRCQAESFLWYIYHERIEVYVDNDGQWWIRAKERCNQLTKDGRCKVYSHQPGLCSDPVEEGAKVFKDLVRHHFRTEKELLEYFRDKRPAIFKQLHPDTRRVVNGKLKKPVRAKKPLPSTPKKSGDDDKVDCLECASCCTYLNIVENRPTDADDIDMLLWYIYHNRTELYLDSDGDWSVVFASRCEQLDERNMCRVYSRRPTLCRQFSSDNCHGTDFNGAVKQHFTTDGKLIGYLKKKRPALFKKLSPKLRKLATP